MVIEIPSRRFGKYTVRSRLGTGGMAEVFLAEVVDELGDQLNVALKLMKKGVSEEAFADEADLMGLLSHPNLVQRLEIGAAFGRPFIDRKSTRLNSSHIQKSRMPSSA